MPERFFDNDAGPSFAVPVETCRAQILNDFRILAGGSGQVIDAIASRSSVMIELIEQFSQLFIADRVMKIGLQIMNTRGKTFPNLRIHRLLP